LQAQEVACFFTAALRQASSFNGIPRLSDVAPFIDPSHGRTILIAEALGTEVNWLSATETDPLTGSVLVDQTAIFREEGDDTVFEINAMSNGNA